jgi:hypothetical protein
MRSMNAGVTWEGLPIAAGQRTLCMCKPGALASGLPSTVPAGCLRITASRKPGGDSRTPNIEFCRPGRFRIEPAIHIGESRALRGREV